MRYLLDANIVIALMAGQRAVTGAIERHAFKDIVLSSIVMHELRYGAFASDRIESNLARLDSLRFDILPFDADDALAAGGVRARLRRLGTPIGPYDVLIAGQALARDVTLVSNNVREFQRVAGLRVEDWTQP